jgi:AcrR family transcriptional regulator
MNTVVTSREAILEKCRDMVAKEGLASVSIRAVAEACSVSVGSIYYYFPSKDELLIATIEHVWQDIFHMEECGGLERPFDETVQSVFNQVREGMKEYPHFFSAHSLSIAGSSRNEARETMEKCLKHMKKGLLSSLENDPLVKREVFVAPLTMEAFVSFVMDNLLTSLMLQKDDCEVVLSVVRNVAYGKS